MPLGVIWLVGMTNAFNLLDNMDGLAATLAAIASGYFALDAVTVHPNDTVLVLALSLALACVGFLRFNLSVRGSAEAFMGDSGSQVLGFAVACFGLLTSYKVAGSTAATLLLPILILAVPILDTTLVTVVRLLEGRPVHQGGRDHASHRLVYHGLSEKRSVVLLALVAAALGGTSFAYSVLNNTLVTLFGVLLTFALLVQFASLLSDADRDRSSGTSFFAVHRRRFVEVVVDFALICAAFLAAYLLARRRRGNGHAAVHLHDRAADPARLALPRVHPVRALPRRVALRRCPRRGRRRRGGRDVRVRRVRRARRDPRPRRLPEERVRDRRAHLHRPRRRVALLGARGGARALVVPHDAPPDAASSARDAAAAACSASCARRRASTSSASSTTTRGCGAGGCRASRSSAEPLEIARVLERTRPDIVLVTIPEAERERLDAIVAACAAAGVTCRFVRRDLDLDPVVVLGSAAE